MEDISHVYRFILELNKLKLVLRNNVTEPNRKESTAEHSWSASMIVMTLMDRLKDEFEEIDELKTIKLTMIHDIVEIYAGDVSVFDIEARKNKEKIEVDALKKLMEVNPELAQQLHDLWYEFEDKKSIEAKIAKAADAICPIFQRLQSKQSYIPFNLTIADLEKIKYPSFIFSKTFSALYNQLKSDLLKEKLITN
ncbi:MAG TPA: HD domain-containing protein [Gammaproteobacteria bacterium]|nr:HD domain-containing protein [Gammaproteobacteria bacterium]